MDKLIVFRKTWEYLFWLRPTVERFTKVHKYSLGVEMQANAMHLLKLVISANYAELKDDMIQAAVVEQEVQRVFLRLAFEHKLLSQRQFEFGSVKLDEIGRLLRGWEKGKTKGAAVRGMAPSPNKPQKPQGKAPRTVLGQIRKKRIR